ncbi:MAG: hypothetical protein AB2693_19280 [Candidatus Thiodiazotropha sp.]
MKLLALFLVFFLRSTSAFMHESTFFHNVGQFSMSRSRWLVSFVIDLGVYENFLMKLSQDISNASCLADEIINRYDDPLENRYKQIFTGLQSEVSVLQSMHNDIVSSFNDYKLLREPRKRTKRAIFGFVGDIFSSLFGVLTEADVSKIQRNVRALAQNQMDLAHVIKESISVLNVTRVAVKENRQKINTIIETISLIEDNIINLSDRLEHRINGVEKLTMLFAQMNLIIEEIKNAMARSMYFYLHFQMQVQSITMQRLSPSTISADNLRDMLLIIQGRLPKTIGLPYDPRTHIFEYYKFLTSVTLFEDNHVIITTNIPLIEFTQRFDVFKAYSLPVPLLGTTPGDKKELLAYYRLESSYLAVNPERTKYILLDEDHAFQCSGPDLKICNIKEPIRNINVGRSCIVSNFVEDKYKVRQHCDIWLQHSRLPTAKYLSNDVYLIITKNKMTFNIACNDDRSEKQKFKVKPPYGFLNLHKNCVATSNAFTLMGYYERQTMRNVTNPVENMLKFYNFSDFKVWNSINRLDVIKNHTFTIPEKLDDLEEFPLNTLIDHLNQLRPMEEMTLPKHFPMWGYVIIIIGVIIIFIVLACCYCKFKNSMLSKLICYKRKARTRKQKTLMPNNELANGCGESRCQEDIMVMSTLLNNGTHEDTKEDLSGGDAVVKRKFPLLDSQVVCTAVTK